MSFPVHTVFAGDVLPIFFSTYAGATGASITMTGLAITDVEIFKDGSVTQRSSDAGYVLLDTDGIDFDGITGIHGFSIDTGDNTDAGFYTVGAWFHVVVSAVTVDSQTVNFIAAAFRIVAAEAIAGKPKVDVDAWIGTAAATPATAGIPDINVKNIDNDAASASGTVTFPNATLASTTNITAGTIATTTNLTNLPAITANWLTAAGTAADFGTELAAAIWQDAVAGDFTVASSIGKALYTGNIVPGAAGGHFIAGTNAATTVTTSFTTTFTGNLTGSVGSVTGAVGSVTGAVGSVTGAVGSVTGLTAATVHADLDDIQARLPAALTANGNIKADALRWNGLVTVDLPLTPTTAGRALDVTATGAAGVDWGNVENSTTVVDLTGTVTGAAIGGRLGDITGSLSGSVGSVTGLTTATIATGVWQDATAGDFTTASSIGKALYTGNFVPGAAGGHFIAGTNAATTITTGLTTTFTGSLTGSVGSVTGSVGSVTGAVGSVTGAVGSVTGAVGSIATGGIVAASIATDAFTNAKFADNCFDSANFTSGSFDAVWAATVRTLSAGDNIVLAKGTGVTGFNDIAAADVWAVGTRTITGGTVGTITGLTIANVENATTRFLTTIVLDGAVYQFTANALELGPSGGAIPTVGQIADEVQTRTIARVTEVDHIGPAGIDGSTFDANAIGPGVLDTGAISNTNFAAGAITSTVLANDAITAAKVAADVSTEINTALSAAHGAGAWGAGAGSGAFPITVTVNDGAAALQNVTVGVFDGATLAASGTTNVSGQVTFSLDAATYTVALVKGGYTFTTASRTVTGNQTGTLTTALSMTASAISAPSSPANCTVAGTIRDLQGNALPGAVLKVRLVPAIANRPITANGNVVALVSDDAVADVNGLVTLELVRTDEMDQDGCTYAFVCTAAEMDESNVVLAQATLDLADL